MFWNKLERTRRVRELFGCYAAEGLELAQVSSAAHEQYRVLPEPVSAGRAPVPGDCDGADAPAGGGGDWVAAPEVDPALVLIGAVLPRPDAVCTRRGGQGGRPGQASAASVDVAVVESARLDGDFNLRRHERYLV